MQTIMERMEERLSSVEATLQQLGPVQVLQERLSQLEHNIYSTKNMLTFDEACRYLGVSESLLYKLPPPRTCRTSSQGARCCTFPKRNWTHGSARIPSKP